MGTAFGGTRTAADGHGQSSTTGEPFVEQESTLSSSSACWCGVVWASKAADELPKHGPAKPEGADSGPPHHPAGRLVHAKGKEEEQGTWPGVPRSALARLRPMAGRGDCCRLAWASASASRAAASRFSLFAPRFAALSFCAALVTTWITALSTSTLVTHTEGSSQSHYEFTHMSRVANQISFMETCLDEPQQAVLWCC